MSATRDKLERFLLIIGPDEDHSDLGSFTVTQCDKILMEKCVRS